MAITRLVPTDDGGGGTTGTILNAAYLSSIYDSIENASVMGYGCSVFNSSQQTVSTSGAVAITFDTDSFDNGGLHSTSSNTSRVTISSSGAGYYLAIGSVSFAPSSQGYRQVDIRKNGSLILDSVTMPFNVAGSPTLRLQVQSYVSLSVGDYLEVLATQTSTGSLATGSVVSGLENRFVVTRQG